MKNTALQLAKQIVIDNEQYIKGNVAEYMILEVDSNDNNFYQYLTDEEIEEMNGNVQKTNDLGEEVYVMLRENFDYDISEFES